MSDLRHQLAELDRLLAFGTRLTMLEFRRSKPEPAKTTPAVLVERIARAAERRAER